MNAPNQPRQSSAEQEVVSSRAQEWLQHEAADDPGLLGMLLTRESIIDAIASGNTDGEQERQDLAKWHDTIAERKAELGLDSTVHPDRQYSDEYHKENS
jgi:hypothetical protein